MIGVGIIIGALVVIIIGMVIYGEWLVQERERLVRENEALRAQQGRTD